MILVVTAVQAERDAVTRDLAAEPRTIGRYELAVAQTGAGEVCVVAGGIGMAASAAATATLLTLGDYDAVISMGIAGGFDGRAAVGDVVVATRSVACQLGADSPDGYLDFGDLGLAETVLPAGPAWPAIAERLAARTGQVLTVCTVTGTDARAVEYTARWDPVAEAMEGFGVVTAARAAHVIPYEIRTISNRVGRRDRSSWDITGALDALSRAAKTLFKEPVR